MEITSLKSPNPVQSVQVMEPRIKETQNHFLVMLPLPQFKKEELRIEIRQHQRLVISELFGALLKSVMLSSRVDADQAKVSFIDGVLQILLPKDRSSLRPNSAFH